MRYKTDLMFSIPKFKLQKERTAALWLGLVFFLLIALLSLFYGTLPLFPPHKKTISKQEIPKELKNLNLPETTIQDLLKMTEQKESSHPKKISIRHINSIIFATTLLFWPIIPLGKELRRRKKQL